MAKAARKSATGSRKAKSNGADSTEAAEADGIDLTALDRDELVQLSKDVEKALKSYDKRKRDEALREMELVAQKHGIALKDIVQGGPKQSVQVPKYEHPENSALTWSGRGRQPAWFKEAIEAGHSRDDLLVA
jgi:DNA-binding protein H-NS